MTKTAKPVDYALIKSNLAARFLHQWLMCGSKPARQNYTDLCHDRRIAKKVMREIVSDGYIDQADHPTGAGDITGKALAEHQAEPVDLPSLYKFDRFQDSDDHAYVRWNDLTVGQKKSVYEAVNADSTSYRFQLVTGARQNWIEKTEFVPGTGATAAGNAYDFFVAVTNDALLQKHRACVRDLRIKECMDDGLTWYLQKTGEFGSDEEVKVKPRTPGLFREAGLPCDPERWPLTFSDVVNEIKGEVLAAQKRLETLKKLEAAVVKAGGWDKFTAGYRQAIEAYVDEHLAKKK